MDNVEQQHLFQPENLFDNEASRQANNVFKKFQCIPVIKGAFWM